VSKEWLVFWAVLIGLGAVAVYAIACFVWPFTDCGKCGGGGRFRSPSGKAFRRCRRCKGTGTQVRLGRRLWTWLAGVKKSAIG
jgi:hypothetical protein